MSSDKSRIERIIDQINAGNAKKVALLVVVGFALYHGLIHSKYGGNSCKGLLSDGRYKGDKEWQPYGCMLHHYSKIDTRKCLRYLAFYGTKTHFAFIGDSRLQELYMAFVNYLKETDEPFSRPVTMKSPNSESRDYFNLSHTDNTLDLKVEYIKAPLVNNVMIDTFRQWQWSAVPPSVIIVNSGLDAIVRSNASLVTLEEFRFNLTRLVQPIDSLHWNKSRVLWALQAPINAEKLKPELKMVSNHQIDLYNKASLQILSNSEAKVWWSFRLVGQGMISDSKDGIHLPHKSLQHDTQILLNMYCNDYMNFNDGTCCSSREPYTMLQIVTFSILCICVFVALLMLLYKMVQKCRGLAYTHLPENAYPIETVTPTGYYTLFTSLAKMALIMVYFFVCDRTAFFMKENKYYSEFSFWLPVAYITILGLFFTENSKFTKVLHRDQLNELKGWMLLVILVYQVTGATRVLPINMHIKILISTYLFLLGYEQFCSTWRRGDFGIVGFFKVMFELNFMTVTLCLCMNRPYQFYYFVPLMSFWYVMVYCFLALPPRITSQSAENNGIQYFSLLIKFIVLFTVITTLFLSEVFFEKVFVTRPWKALFVTTDDDIREWWFRWKLDRYSAMYGMAFAVLLILANKFSIYDDHNHGNLFSKGFTLIAVLGAAMGLGCYLVVTFLCHDEMDCSEIHSYIVFIPIVSYVVLRNISGVLRTKYSSLFAWFGDISLELFISQYHIWLAADTHGVLVLLPGFPVLNVLLTSFIFVCASHEVHRLTKVLLPYAVPSDWKCVLRNFILFLAVLVPIGINDGMF